MNSMSGSRTPARPGAWAAARRRRITRSLHLPGPARAAAAGDACRRRAPAPARGAALRLVGALACFAVGLSAGCAGGGPNPDTLRASFAATIAGVASISDMELTGDELTFTWTRGPDDEIRWRVSIDSMAVEPPAVEGAPIQGRVVSSWYADGELVEPLGSMSRLPDEILEAGIAQECWALWDEESGAWGWS